MQYTEVWIKYVSKLERRDRHLARALEVILKGNPAWGYRLGVHAP